MQWFRYSMESTSEKKDIRYKGDRGRQLGVEERRRRRWKIRGRRKCKIRGGRW